MRTAGIGLLCGWLVLLGGCGRPDRNRLAGGDAVGNGGGMGEKILLVAFSRLRETLSACLSQEACAVDTSERVLLNEILRGLESGRETEDELVFQSEKQLPGFFELPGVAGGTVRSAKTGSEAGARIFINTDHLYLSGQDGTRHPIDEQQGVALLIHEMAHHYGVGSSDAELRELDRLSAKVLLFLRPLRIRAFPFFARDLERLRDRITCRVGGFLQSAFSFTVLGARKLEVIRPLGGGRWVLMSTGVIPGPGWQSGFAVVYVHAVLADEETGNFLSSKIYTRVDPNRPDADVARDLLEENPFAESDGRSASRHIWQTVPFSKRWPEVPELRFGGASFSTYVPLVSELPISTLGWMPALPTMLSVGIRCDSEGLVEAP